MIYTSHTDITSASGRPTASREADEKEKIILRKYHLYAVGICAAIALGAAGCSAGANAETMSGSSVTAEENTEETTVSDTTVVESVTGAIESMEESQPEVPQSVRIYGPVTKMEDGRLSIKLDEFREFRVGEIRNSIQPELKKKEGHMGLGLGNVRNTLEKYHGTMKTEETKEEFQVRLMLPMEKR